MEELVCPKCGAKEMHPDGDKLLIRGHKVWRDGSWWSKCLVCSGYYDKDLNCPDPWAKTEGGWFRSS